MKTPIYPSSFPNSAEESFLQLVLASPADFSSRWSKWSSDIIFDDIDPAIVRLLPLLSMRLDENQIRGPLARRIHGVYKFAWFKNQQLMSALSPVLEACHDKDIPVLLLKGLPLLLEVYKNTGARLLGDGDILIQPKNALLVFELLNDLGWRHKDPSLVGLKKFGLNDVVHATTFINESGVHLEVHWHVYHIDPHPDLARLIFLRDIKPKHQSDCFWQDSLTIDKENFSFSMPSITDLFIHVVIHGAEGNNRRPLRWVADAIWLLRHHQIDWDQVLNRVEREGHTFHMQIAVDYLIKRFDISFPASFITSLGSLKTSGQSIRDYYRLANIYYALLGNFPILWYRYWRYESSGSWWDKVSGFSTYIAKAWNLSADDNLIKFIWRKYQERTRRWFSEKV